MRGAAGDAGEDAGFLRQLARAAQRIAALDGQDLVDQSGPDRVLGELWNEVRRPALHQVRAEERMAFRWRAVGATCLYHAAAQERRVVGLANNDLGLRPFLLQHARNALQRATGPHPGDPIIEPLAFEILEDLDRRGPGME